MAAAWKDSARRLHVGPGIGEARRRRYLRPLPGARLEPRNQDLAGSTALDRRGCLVRLCLAAAAGHARDAGEARTEQEQASRPGTGVGLVGGE